MADEPESGKPTEKPSVERSPIVFAGGMPVAVRLGRPPWIPPDPAAVEALAARGLNDEQIAYSLGIHPATLYRKKKVFGEFCEAIKRGRSKGIMQIASRMFDDALAGNTIAGIFYLKSQGKWRDHHPDEPPTDLENQLTEFQQPVLGDVVYETVVLFRGHCLELPRPSGLGYPKREPKSLL